MDMKIFRVLALPATLEAGALYLLRNTVSGLVEAHIAHADGLTSSRMLTKADVDTLIEDAVPARVDPVTISATGDATWEVSFDGSEDATAVLTLTDTGAVAGEYSNITIDSKGRVTAVRAITGGDIGRGEAGGVAPLDENGLVPASFLPSYVDDVIEVEAYDQLPGELADPGTNGVASKGKIYVVSTVDGGAIYRWSGTGYIEIPSGFGISDSSLKLYTARTIAIIGDATWEVSFDGSENISGELTLADTGVVAGEYTVLTVDSKGRATAGRALIEDDIPMLTHVVVQSAASIYIGTPEW